jgi:Tol biopolymer transport system component
VSARARMASGILAVVLLVAVGGSTQAAQRSPARAADTLLFARDDGIWTARSNGTHERQVVSAKLKPDQASLAAEADLMVFRGRVSRPDAKRRLYVQALDGTDRQRLSVSGFDPRLSPDGRTILFGKYAAHRLRLYTVPTKGGPVTELFDALGGDNRDPSYTPDGRIIFVHVDIGVGSSLYTADGDGADPQELIADGGKISGPSYPVVSPDGQLITMVAARSSRQKGADVWVVEADGSNPTNLTHDTTLNSFPVFSPAGDQIAWLRETGNIHISTGQELWAMNADGSDKHLLLDDVQYGSLAWR